MLFLSPSSRRAHQHVRPLYRAGVGSWLCGYMALYLLLLAINSTGEVFLELRGEGIALLQGPQTVLLTSKR